MKARPLRNQTALIDGGKTGTIYLRPNQKWEVTYYDEENIVEIEYKFISLYMNKSEFEKRFRIVKI